MTISRLLVHVEGPTEETFVNEVLRPHLLGRGYASVAARLVGNARLRSRRGGIRAWPSVKSDILRHLKEDLGCAATTMVDYYRLPAVGERAWPKRADGAQKATSEKASLVEEALRSEIVTAMGSSFNSTRFVPFVTMHEFEGLLFSECQAFAKAISRADLASELAKIREGFETPEDINDSEATAPSKRVENLIPNYEKPLLGTLAALEIGLPTMRTECPHLHQWLLKLEFLAGSRSET
jgi:hypothetical protein